MLGHFLDLFVGQSTFKRMGRNQAQLGSIGTRLGSCQQGCPFSFFFLCGRIESKWSLHSWHEIGTLGSQCQELVHVSAWFILSLCKPKINNVIHQTFGHLVHSRCHQIMHRIHQKFSQDQNTLFMSKSKVHTSYAHSNIKDRCTSIPRFNHMPKLAHYRQTKLK